MKQSVKEILGNLLADIPVLCVCKDALEKAYEVLRLCYLNNGKVMICGNGGSAADSEHIVGELMKGFILKRKICDVDRKKIMSLFPDEGKYLSDNLQGALPAISLVSQISISTAFINDVAADMVYAQQVYGYAKTGDVLIGISTSGNADNVLNSIKVAKSLGVICIGMTGVGGGALKKYCDVTINVPSNLTYKIQEYHQSIYHALCAMIEAEFFDE